MLKLLSTFDAAIVAYYLIEGEKDHNGEKSKNWQLAFAPEVKQSLIDKNNLSKVLMYETFIKHAIDADEMPAISKPIGKPTEKKIYEKVDVPKDIRDDMPTRYDYWITLEDLFCFLERPPYIPKKYAHGRDALARLLCTIIDRSELSKNNQQSLIEHLEHKIESVETELKPKLQLRDNTLKGCCREILDTYPSINNGKPEK